MEGIGPGHKELSAEIASLSNAFKPWYLVHFGMLRSTVGSQ